MKHYLDLIPISAKVHKKQNRMTKFCIILAVFLVTVIFGMAEMEIRSQKTMAIQQYGNWHVSFHEINEEQARMIAARPQVNITSWYGVLNYRLEEEYLIQGNKAMICGFDEEFLEINPSAQLLEGSFPKGEQEAAITQNVKKQLGLNVGDYFSLTVPQKEVIQLKIVGVAQDTSLLQEKDAFGVFVNTEEFREITPATKENYYESIYYVQFDAYSNIQSQIKEIKQEMGLADEQVSEKRKT